MTITKASREIERLQHDLEHAERERDRVKEEHRRMAKGVDRQARMVKAGQTLYEALAIYMDYEGNDDDALDFMWANMQHARHEYEIAKRR